MAQATMTKAILRTIGDTISSIVGKYYYLTRPSSTSADKGDKHFAVINLPTRFRRVLTGYKKGQTRTTGIIYVFSKAKSDNTPNIDDLTGLSERVGDLFPIVGDGFSCMDYDIQYMGDDGYGYQWSRISFTIFIKRSLTTQ